MVTISFRILILQLILAFIAFIPVFGATPTTQNATIASNEDNTRTFNSSDFPFTDADGDNLVSVRIVNIGGSGTWKLNNGNLTTGTSIPVADISTLTFQPEANANGNNYASIQFRVSDGTTESAPATMTINVTAVNDLPSFTKGSNLTVSKGAALQTIADWATNISPGPADESGQIVSFEITNNTNAALFTGAGLAPAISSAGVLTFRPNSTAGTATISVRIKDNGPGTNTSAVQTFTITVDDVPDVFIFSSPVANNAGQATICEGDLITFIASPPGANSYRFKVNGSAVNTSANSTFTSTTINSGAVVTVEVRFGATGDYVPSANSITVVVNAKPAVSITAPTVLTYNIIEAPVDLAGSPANGTFSGRGVVETSTGFRFSPELAGVGTHSIVYEVNAGDCKFTTSKNFIVVQEGRIFNNIDPAAVYCTNSSPLTFNLIQTAYDPTVEEPIEFLYWNYPGWIVIPAPNNVFDPSGSYYNLSVLSGLNYIGVRLKDKNSGFTREIFQSVKIVASPTVGFRGLTKTFFCNNEDTDLTLTGIINGEETSTTGSFKIQLPDNSFRNLSNRTFNPSDFTASGTYKVIFEAGVGSCASSETQAITIQAAPQVNFSFANTCAGDTVVFTNLSTAGAATDVLVYNWDFGDGFLLTGSAGPVEEGTHNGQTTGTYVNPKHKYLNPGSYIAKLSVSIQTATECAPEKQMAIVISPEPQAKFTVTKVCANDFTVFDGITGNVTIAKWSWDFGDGGILTAGNGDISNGTHGGRTRGSFENPEHQYAVTGTYMVKLTVESDKGCSHTLVKMVSIFPQVNTFPYREDFETQGKNGWVSGGKNPSWQLRTTSISPRTDSLFIQYAASGQNAWITNDDSTYNNNEVSYVESPCFDLRPLSRPMIVIKTAFFTDRGLDGAILQATIDDGVSWQTVGKLQEGENWYNTALIIAYPDTLAPINDRTGWSGIDTLWKESRYPLDDFKNQPLVRFRIAFGSNSENTPGIPPAGFAFDDVFIGERSRIVLLEHFTNTNSDTTLPPDTIKINDKAINTFISNEAVVLRYHVEIPGKDDPINQQNQADPSARALLYGISSLPRTAIDGQNILNDAKHNIPFVTSETTPDANFGPRQYKSRTLVQSPFGINITFGAPDTTLHITADITKTDISSAGPFVVQMALVQKSVIAGTDTFKNVVRKLLPNAAGTRIDDPAWAQGSSKSVSDTLVPNILLGPLLQSQSDGFAIAVFIQDEKSKEVYQANIADIPADRIASLVTGTDELQNKNITIYPNPAGKEVHILFSQKLTEVIELNVFDAYGKAIDFQVIARGSSDFILYTDSYSNGFYILEARQRGSQSGIRKKLVIAK